MLRGARLEALLPIDGAYFLLTDVAGRGFSSDADFCRRLVTEMAAAMPTSGFYAKPPLPTLCFAKTDDTIRAATERLARL